MKDPTPTGQIAAIIAEQFGTAPAVPERTTYLPTGIPVLDYLMLAPQGRPGGLAQGKNIELWGEQNNGKTLLCYLIAAMYQEFFPDSPVVWFDSENSFDRDFAERIGVDLDPSKLMLVPSADLEQFGSTMSALLRQKAPLRLIIVDSVANLVDAQASKDGLQGGWGEKTGVANRPRQLARVMREINHRLTAYEPAERPTLILVNQAIAAIGNTYQTHERPGGNGYKHNIQVSFIVRGTNKYPDDDKTKHPTHFEVRLQTTRSKISPSLMTDKETHIHVYFDNAIRATRTANIMRSAIALGIIKRKGAWYSLNVKRDGEVVELFKLQGEAKVFDYLLRRPRLRQRLYERIGSKMLKAANMLRERYLVEDDNELDAEHGRAEAAE
ncbi:hypothetical protein [Microcystis phage Mvi-JY20]|uniref:RecA family profile 1 domain-containing protein n=1 Tax=Microcystis phage Mvi-JY20 TaxID=3128146 RepID=A0AAX4QI35_9CAUD